MDHGACDRKPGLWPRLLAWVPASAKVSVCSAWEWCRDGRSDTKERAADVIAKADVLLITAGAGIGVDSGLPDFRGDQVNLVTECDRLDLWNLAGRPVGRLAKKVDMKDGCRVVEA